MVLLTYFLHESDPRRDHQQIVLYSFCRSMRLSSSSKIITQIFLYEDLSTLALYTSVGCISSRMPAGPQFITQPILLSENIPNILYKSSTKHKEVRPDWNDKNDECKLRALVSHGRFYQWLRLPFLKKYLIKCERFRLWIVLFWTKNVTTSHIIFTI